MKKIRTTKRLIRTLRDTTYTLEKDAHLLLCAIITKAPKKEVVIEINLNGIDARADIVSVFIGNGSDHFRVRIIVRHHAEHTIARVYGRSILFDAARSDVQGIHIIEKIALRADTYFSHHALLLSTEARALAIPSLEILADDVKAGHAVTAGPLMHEAIIYLRTRGISKHTAKILLVRGFLNADSGKIIDTKIRKRFEHIIQTIIHQ